MLCADKRHADRYIPGAARRETRMFDIADIIFGLHK